MEVKEASAKYAELVEPSGDAVPFGYKPTDAGIIPVEWNSLSLADLCLKIQDGTHFSPKIGGHDYLYLTSKNVRFGFLDISTAAYVDAVQHEAIYKRCDVKQGDLLLTKDGANTGNAALNTLNDQFSLLSSVAFLRFDARKHNAGYFLQQALSTQGQRRMKDAMSGNAITRLTLEKIRKLIFPTAPLPEQNAIAETLSDADTLIESLEQLIAKKRQIKQGTMQALLTGKQRLPGFNDEWQRCHLADLVAFHKGKGLPKSALDAFALTPCIHYGELFTQYAETIREVISYTGQFADALFSCVQDVLMPTSDVTPTGLAKASCVMMKGVILGGDILVIRPDTTRLYGPFLSYVIRYSKHQILQLVTGSTVFHIYASDMKKFTIAVPSVKEQEQIIRVLDDMDSELAELETRLAKTRQLKQGMMQELLTGRIRLV